MEIRTGGGRKDIVMGHGTLKILNTGISSELNNPQNNRYYENENAYITKCDIKK